MQYSPRIELQPDNSQVNKIKPVQDDPTIDESNPKYKSLAEKANIFSFINFTYMYNTVKTAKKLLQKGKSLDHKTLPGLTWNRRPAVLEDVMADSMFSQRKSNPRKKPSLALAILRSVRWPLLSCITLQITALFLRIFLVWVAKRLLDALSDVTAPDSDGFMWAGILSGVLILALYAEHHYYHLSFTLPAYIRSSLVSMIYTKISRLSLYSLNELTLGKLVNVVANDVNVFERTGGFFPNLFVGIINLIASTSLLWIFFGPSCLVGVGYCIIGFPIQQAIASLSDKPRSKKNEVTDERVKLTNEVIDGIRLIKMYTWELTFRDIINKIREREVKLLKDVATLEGASRGLAMSTQLVAAFLIWMTFVLAGNELSVSIVFPSIFLIGVLKQHSVFFFAMALGFVSEAKLVVKRLEAILDAPETGDMTFEEPNNRENAIEFDSFCAYWTKGSDKTLQTYTNETLMGVDHTRATLFDINMDIKKGSLNALIGKVGSGKSSFLLSFTGEMPKTDGSLRYKGSIAYVEQEPTIFAGTLRENILFGKTYEPHFYKTVVKVCNLESDLLLFPKGDMSEIGEKGINLSGGQKARLSLARALYADADIYLLDDPLSAVDAKVAKSLYQDAIVGHLKGKTVILATHQVHFIKDLENIMVIDDGKIVGNGNFRELMRMNIEVEKLFSAEYRRSMTRLTLTDIRKLSEPKTEINLRKRGDNELEELEEEDEEEVPEKKVDDKKGDLFASEDAYAGEVSFKTYMSYASSMGSKFLLLGLFLLFLSNELSNVAFSRIAGVWAGQGLDRDTSLGVMGGITAFMMVTYIIKSILLSFMLLKAARSLHDKMLDRILRNPVQFFDTNPVGRILNRFANDLGVLDRFLQLTLTDVADQVFNISSTLITIAVINPLLLIPIAITLVLIVLILKFCYQSIKQSRNYELGSRSPMYSLFSSSLSGIIVIRSYKQTDMFVQKFRSFLYNNTKGSLGFLCVSRFFGFFVDVTYNLSAIASIFIVTATKNSNPGLSGLSIAYILSISGTLQYSLRQIVQANVLMASVGRVRAYCETKTEAALTLPTDNDSDKANWPTEGNIEFNKVYMKYRENTDHVIRDLTVCAKPGEKIGCVGRTGAGKSSIIQILFRMMEIDRTAETPDESFVKIDGIDSESVGLHKIRNNIAIIPQTPFVFTGTIKRNLDPLGQFTDEQLWHVLEDVNLKTHVEKLDGQLYTDMTNASSVFSVGQKQLICLARAILKQTKILVLDEATANVDMETDNFIQKKIMEKFSDCTIFTIAHRLSTIANYDKILVLDKGRKVEFDEPYRLLVKEIGDDSVTNTTGHFASMVLNTGPRTARQILKLAKAKFIENIENNAEKLD